MSPLAALALLAAQQAAPAEPEAWRAIGAGPLWQAWLWGTSMSFETSGRPRVSVERPSREETEGGFTYRTDALTISVIHGDCIDALSGRHFADRVTVQVGAAQYQGCGGEARDRTRPEPYGAGGGEPFWSLEIADGRLYFGVNDDVWIVPAPRPRVTRNGRNRRYTAPGITVLLRRADCQLEDERTYADEVRVSAGQWRVLGCGGRVVREAPGD